MGTDLGNGDADPDGEGSETDVSAFLWPTEDADVFFFLELRTGAE
jgi:hypothetical protein